jgi:hypothetical protein
MVNPLTSLMEGKHKGMKTPKLQWRRQQQSVVMDAAPAYYGAAATPLPGAGG